MSARSEKSATVMALCERHLSVDIRQRELHGLLGDLESTLADRHRWFDLTRVQRRALPAAQSFHDLEDELEQLGRESAQLVSALRNADAFSMSEVTAKLEVVLRVIEPDDYPDAYAVFERAVAELKTVSE
ncbi:MAG: hypothetical protein EON93_10390 [Burkholderiales bacterium]|nr:MAG: hypothetical protein EON93_10390 [Burkholderiales bacterium]